MMIETQGYVLHRRSYRETSAIIDVITTDLGRISFVAKGMQRSKSPLKGLLQPMQLLHLSLSGRHSLKTLRTAEAVGKGVKLEGKALYSLFYVNELLERLLSQDAEIEGVFALYHHTLTSLAEGNPIEPVLRRFELLLLEQLGYGIDYTHDCNHDAIQNNDNLYQFTPDNGFIPLTEMTSRLNYVFKGKYIKAIQAGNWEPQVLRDAKRLTRLALHPLLGSKPLKSKSLFMKLE